MKNLKGISWFEQQADKMVLGLFALFLIAVLIMQAGLLGGAPTIKVDGRDVPIDRSFEAVRSLAERKKAALESEQVDSRIPASLPSVKEQFESAIAGGHRTLPAFALGPPQVLSDTSTRPDPGPIAPIDALLAEIVVPPPVKPLAAVYEGTIDPIIVAESGEALAKWLPKEQPFDIRAVSIESALDSARLRETLAAAPADRQAMPPSYWQNRLEIVDVEFIRQELGSDGQWGPEQVVTPLPGRASLRDKFKDAQAEPSVVQGLLDDEIARRQEIRRPDFLATISGEPWVWPARAIEQRGDPRKQSEVDRLIREYKQIDTDIKQISDQLDRLSGEGKKPAPANNNKPGDKKSPGDKKNPPDNKDKKPGDGGGGGGGGGGGRGLPREPSDPLADASRSGAAGGEDYVWPQFPWYYRAQLGGGGGGPKEDQGPSPEEARKLREQKKREQLQQSLKKYQDRQKDIEKELEKRGVNAKGLRIADQGAGSGLDEPLNSATDPGMAKVTIWGHDIAVHPGATYRYKARLHLTNPLGGRADALREEQKPMASTVVLTSADSEWSEPVHVLPTTVYYVTNATPAGGGGIAAPARATVELYEFFYGYWRRASISIQPGDALIGAAELPELETFKLDRDADGHHTAGDRASVPRERSIAADAFLLDVASAIGGAQGATEVFLRSAQNLISLHRPADEGAQNSVRARLEGSAALGKSAVLRVPGTAAPAAAGQGVPGQQPGQQPGAPGDREQPTKPPEPTDGPPSLPKGPSNY